MASIKPFKALRAIKEKAALVAAPSDSGNRLFALEEMKKNECSYLHVVKPYLHFDDIEKIPEKHYTFGKNYLDKLIENGTLIRENEKSIYIYRSIKGSKAYTGIIAIASIDDYNNNIILKHENTRSEKQAELLEHIKYIKNIGSPVLVTYPDNQKIDELIHDITLQKPEYNFISDDQVKHNLWPISNEEDIEHIENEFAQIDKLYIADGHHRSAGAAAYSSYCRAAETETNLDADFNYMPVCLIPFSKLKIYEYHRLIKDSGINTLDFIQQLNQYFEVHACGDLPFQPLEKGEFGIYIKDHAYQLSLKNIYKPSSILDCLDVSVVEQYILNKLLNVIDSKTDPRLMFLDGSKGIGTLQHIVDKGDADIAITLFPTSIDEVIEVAENNLIMPPKSTWIEPKIRTGMIIYEMSK